MADIRDFMASDEVMIGHYGKSAYLTNMRVINYTGKIDSFFKDMMLDSISTVSYTKKHYQWMISFGLIVFATMMLLSYFIPSFMLELMIAGVIFSLGIILSFIFIVDKSVILHSAGMDMELRGIGMDFIIDLRKQCYKNRFSKKKK